MPEWVVDLLGSYDSYFADQKGSYIRLAYADNVTGPWTIYLTGSLQLRDSKFLTEIPEVTES